MHPTDELVRLLKRLKLSGILQSLDLRVRQSLDDNLTHGEFLVRLFCDEVERREARQLDTRLRRASFEHGTTLEDFDFTFNPEIPKAKLLELATCAFVDRHENVLLVGKTGLGKSHLAQALGHRACLGGHNVLFIDAAALLGDLRAARADQSLERRINQLAAPDVLIIDDVGLRPLRHDEPMDLYELIRRRHRRTSTIVTSNRDIEEWPPLFLDPVLASAALDRLLEGAHVLRLDGDTYRNPPPEKARRRRAA